MQLKNAYSSFFPVLLICLFTAPIVAQQFNYAPNAIHFCQVRQKYDSSLGLGYSFGINSRGADWQLAFSPVKNVALMMNYLDASSKQVKKQLIEGSSSRFAEIGVGAYESAGRGVASLFIGYGQGSIFSNYVQRYKASFDLHRWFIQPAMVFESKNFAGGLALRFTRLAYAKAEVDYSLPPEDLRSIQAIEAKSPIFIPEFGMHTAIKAGHCQFSLNVTSLFYDANTYNFQRLTTTLMLTVDVGATYQKEQAPGVQ